MFHWVLLLTMALVVASAFEQEVLPHCGPEERVCEFKWEVSQRETMVQYNTVTGTARPVYRDTSTGNDVFVARDAIIGCNDTSTLNDEDLEEIATADGRYKVVYTINGQFPGPNMVVYEGQQVVVRLTNALLSEGVTIHWHGIHQRGTPWMDGVAGITQCPINPSETFTYRFLVTSPGTFWYHSHLGLQRTDGLFGALVVLPRTDPPSEPIFPRPAAPRPSRPVFDKDFLFVVQDWFVRASTEDFLRDSAGLAKYSAGYDNLSTCYEATLGFDQTLVGVEPFETALINGKGTTRSFPELLTIADQKTPNMERFRVHKGGIYRFRVINPSLSLAFQIKIGGHKLNVISLDGMNIEKIEADSVIVQPGERVDFYLVADQDPAAYIIEAATLELPEQGQAPHAVYGAFWYEEDLTFNYIRGNPCQPPCVVFNCPFEEFPRTGPSVECRNIDSVRGSVPYELGPDSGGDVEEHFLNFYFPNEQYAAINGIQFVLPDRPPQLFGELFPPFRCDECLENHCKCTHHIELTLNKVIQLVFVNTDSRKSLHPIHLHGHHFYVTKVGYPNVDPLTRAVLSLNRNVTCNGPRCEWTNPDWSDGRVPDMNLENPPLKDTVMVPGNGYVVVRFKADNPGWWVLHCHMEFHQALGMMLVMREGGAQHQNPPPRDFPTCGSFDWSEQQFWETISPGGGSSTSPSGNKKSGGGSTSRQGIQATWDEHKVLIIVGSVITFLLLVIVVILVVLCCKLTNSRHGYQRL